MASWATALCAAPIRRTHGQTNQHCNATAQAGNGRPFSNRLSFVNPILKLASPGSWFSSRSIMSPQHQVRSRGAARSTTSFADESTSSRPSRAVTFILAPLGKHSVRMATEQELERRSFSQLPRHHANDRARLNARCYEGSRQAYAPAPRAPYRGRRASRSPPPSP